MGDRPDKEDLARMDARLSEERCQLCINLGLNPCSDGNSFTKDQHVLSHLNAEQLPISIIDEVAALCFPNNPPTFDSPILPCSTTLAPDTAAQINEEVVERQANTRKRRRQTTIEEFAQIITKKPKIQPDVPLDSPEEPLLNGQTTPSDKVRAPPLPNHTIDDDQSPTSVTSIVPPSGPFQLDDDQPCCSTSYPRLPYYPVEDDLPSTSALSSPPTVSRSKHSKAEFTCVLCQSAGRNKRSHLFIKHIKRTVVQCPYCKFGSQYKRTTVRDHVAKEHPQEEQRIIDKRKEDYIQTVYKQTKAECFPPEDEVEAINSGQEEEDKIIDLTVVDSPIPQTQPEGLFCLECKEFHPESARQHIFQSHIKTLTVLCGYCEFGAHYDTRAVESHMKSKHKEEGILWLKDQRSQYVMEVDKWSYQCYRTSIEKLEKQELKENVETVMLLLRYGA